VLEIDPCFAWQQQVMAGVGVAPDIKALYKDMHTYLAGMHHNLALYTDTLDTLVTRHALYWGSNPLFLEM